MTDRAFKSLLKTWIDEALSNGRLSINELIRRLPGVHPDIVASQVQGDPRVADPTPAVEPHEPTHEDHFPVPHPLDFDWRFVESSRRLLLERALSLSRERELVMLLGAPSVFRAAIETGFPRPLTLVDAAGYVKPGRVTHARHIFSRDITRDDLPPVSAKVVVTDPPWYEDYSRAFLWAAATMTEPGGTVLLSAPPLGTRPSISEEWQRTIEFASSVHLELVSSENVLRYRMPPFERNALRAAGVSNIDHDWRPGVLCTFVRRNGSVNGVRPLVNTDRECWVEYTLSGVRIRVRHHRSDISDPRLVQLVSGDVLDSVSRRDSRRGVIDVWTSGNRVFGCQDTKLLGLVLQAIGSRTSALSVVENTIRIPLTEEARNHIIETESRVIELIEIETEEYVRHWEG